MSKEAIEHYEAALKEAFPSGATGDVFHHWNEARKALAEQPAQPQEPMISTEHGPWIPSTHPGEEGESYCKRCLLRDKFLGSRQCDPHIVPTPAAQQQEPVAWRWLYNGQPDSEKHFSMPGPDAEVISLASACEFPRTVQYLYTSPQPAQRKPLTDQEAKAITYVGPVYAPDGLVTRSPLAYRKELEAHRLDAIRKTEAAHGIKGDA